MNLLSKDKKLELGIIKRDHEIVPSDFQNPPQGFYLTFVVKDVDKLYQTVREHSFTVLEAPHDTFYGQRRLLLRDPDGTLVDVSSLLRDLALNKLIMIIRLSISSLAGY